MMKCLALLFTAACSMPLSAQTPTEQAGQTTSAAYTSTRISAEFTRKIDTRDSRVGDEIAARTTADATLPDGTELRWGARLSGTIVDSHSKSGGNSTSLLAFTVDRATLPNGQEIRLHTTLNSLSGPPRVILDAEPPETTNPLAGATPGSRSSGRPGGSAVRGLPPLAPSTGTLSGLDATPITVAHSNGPTGLNDPRAAGSSAKGTYVSDAIQVHHYPVANMPGVILSSQVTATISGVLDSPAQNIRVESGTKMTMDASVVPR